jgi:hypothetical protein
MIVVDSGTMRSPLARTGNLPTGQIALKAEFASALPRSTRCGVNGVPFS